MVDRMVRATKGEVALYEEVEESTALTQEAYTIVGIVAATNALGALVGALIAGTNPIFPAIGQALSVVIGYVIWSYLTFFIGTRVFNGTATPGEMMRAIGYAQTPRILAGLLLLIPGLGACLAIVPALWSLYLGFVAVRQALDVDDQKALMTVGIAFVASLVVSVVIASIIGIAAGTGAALTGS